MAASKSHSEAERRRRRRINNHLETLRQLLPGTAAKHADKASLLAEVIERIKELKQRVAEISELGPVPSEVDELSVNFDGPRKLLRACICCEDRPGLMPDLLRTLRGLRLEAVKAEMSTLEGRTKNVLLVEQQQEENMVDEASLLECLEEALKSVMMNGSLKKFKPL